MELSLSGNHHGLQLYHHVKYDVKLICLLTRLTCMAKVFKTKSPEARRLVSSLVVSPRLSFDLCVTSSGRLLGSPSRRKRDAVELLSLFHFRALRVCLASDSVRSSLVRWVARYLDIALGLAVRNDLRPALLRHGVIVFLE